jgi:cell wall-associated NlpC family hydrolase
VPSLVQQRRTRITTLLSGALLAGLVGLVPSTPAQAEPDIADVEARVDRLYHEAEQASERYNDARLELEELERDLAAVSSDQSRQDRRLRAVREQVRDAVIRTYEGHTLSAVGQVALSGDPSDFLSQLSTMTAYDDLTDQLFDTYAGEVKALDIRHQATSQRTNEVAQLEERLAEEKATIEEKLEEAEGLLARLEADEREEIVSRDSERLPTDVPASGRAGAAIQYAMAQVGKAYVYGAAGPSAFDCSGLTMMAYRAAGISLPHSSSAQFSSGTRIAESALQPGDLVFYYSPISHVGIYLGNGMIVDAANPSSGVRVAPLNSMPYVGAVRPG